MGLRRTVHTLLGFADPDDLTRPCRCRNVVDHLPLSIAGGGLRLLAGEISKPNNEVNSSAVGSPAMRPPEWIDLGSRGLHEPYGDDHLSLCTESLGFESLGIGDDDDQYCEAPSPIPMHAGEETRSETRWRRGREDAEPRKLPPPLTWLNGGRRIYFMRATRCDGRIMLTEFTLDRPEVLRASRSDGRLRLDFISHDDRDILDEESEEDDQKKSDREDADLDREATNAAESEWPWDQQQQQTLRSPATAAARCQEVSGNGGELPRWWRRSFVPTA